MIITYMLILAPAREHIEGYFISLFKPNKGFAAEWTRNLIRAFVVISTSVVAVEAPYFSSVLGTVGGLTDAYQSYIIPPLIAMEMFSSHPSYPRRQMFYYLVLLWGIGNVLFTCYRIVDRVRSY